MKVVLMHGKDTDSSRKRKWVRYIFYKKMIRKPEKGAGTIT